jgi:8-oxo-dGTP pyrophosphatase MutT (NUDIX family)
LASGPKPPAKGASGPKPPAKGASGPRILEADPVEQAERVRATYRDPDAIVARLREALLLPLPGIAAQSSMAPTHRLPLPAGPPGSSAARRAAVVVLLYPSGGSLRFPLIVRSDSPGPHGSQIGLPGGELEEGETARDAALRELEEELGVPRHDVEVLGALTPLYISPSSFLVEPFVGACSSRPAFRPSPAEVSSLVEADLGAILGPESRCLDEREYEGARWSIPYYVLGGHAVWGATAMILSELAIVAGSAREPDPPGAPGRDGAEH